MAEFKTNDKIKLNGTVLRVNNYELDTKAVVQLEDEQLIEISNSKILPDVPAAPEEPVEP